jgi:hypothetical protein
MASLWSTTARTIWCRRTRGGKTNNWRLRHESLRPANLHDAQAIFGPDFVLHSIETVFHRLLRETEAIRDFLAGKPFGNQQDQLLFSTLQSQPLVYAGRRKRSRFSFHVPEQRGAKRAGTDCFATLQRSHAFRNVLR